MPRRASAGQRDRRPPNGWKQGGSARVVLAGNGEQGGVTLRDSIQSSEFSS